MKPCHNILSIGSASSVVLNVRDVNWKRMHAWAICFICDALNLAATCIKLHMHKVMMTFYGFGSAETDWRWSDSRLVSCQSAGTALTQIPSDFIYRFSVVFWYFLFWISEDDFGYFSTSVILSVFGCLPAMSGRHDGAAPALAAADLSDADVCLKHMHYIE